MRPNIRRSIKNAGWLSALVLALSFVLPLSSYTTYVDADGRPVGPAGQLFHDADAKRVTSYGYFWEDMSWVAPLIFFLPAALALLNKRGAPRFQAALTMAAPLVAACLLIPLAARVWFADFNIFPWTGAERACGGYVALGSLGCFCITSTILAACRRGTGGETP